MTYRITLLEGDGIGQEIVPATIDVLEATGLSFAWDYFPFGEATGDGLPDNVIDSIRQNHVALKGPTATPLGGGHRSLNVALREKFDLYANVRPVRSIPGIKTRFSDLNIDMLIFRENLGDLYVGVEYLRDGVAVAEAVFAPRKIERFIRFAFTEAVRLGRKRVTVVHKANILKLTHGVTFLDIAHKLANEFPSLVIDDLIIDNFSAQLNTRPDRFDSVVTTNLFGDIISDAAAALVGGLGVAPGANIGGQCAIFEAVHGTAPDIAGKGIANPTSLVLSSAMMLDHLGEPHAAALVRNSVYDVIAEGACVTGDIDPSVAASTDDFTNAVVQRMKG